MGYSYRDISFGNLFLDPENGNVLICDNDNVSPNGFDNCSVYGTPRFMAPEIVVGKDKPSRNTDLYSLSVLLFYMLMLGHPLEGRHEYDIKCMDIHAMNKLFGTNPVFVYDPKDKTNRPVKGYQDNVIIFWNLYPISIRDLFMQSFTEGLTSPNRRVTEKKWMETFANMMTGITNCPKCGAEVFYDDNKTISSVAHTCWNCSSLVKMPAKLVIGKFSILLNNNAKLFAHHIYDNYDMDTVVGSVVRNPQNPNIWGIKNESKENWTYIKPQEIQKTIPTGKSATVAKDAKINFGLVIGEFE